MRKKSHLKTILKTIVRKVMGKFVQAQVDVPAELELARLDEAVLVTLDLASVAGNLSVVLSTDEHMQRLNAQFRGIDAPTDVLSFPADPFPLDEADEEPYLGDVIIGLPYVTQRTQRVLDELILLVVHGTLHLLGYDHDNRESQAEMWQLQAAALKALRIEMEIPAYIHE